MICGGPYFVNGEQRFCEKDISHEEMACGAPGEQRGETLLVAEESCNHHAPGRPDCLICHPQEGQPLPVAIPPKFRHVCPEWDGLEIDETWPEFEACLCFRPKVEAQLSRQESAEDAWKRASESLRQIAIYCFNEWGMEEARNRMMDIRNRAYTPPISPDKEGQ